jgi:hypothetical protein
MISLRFKLWILFAKLWALKKFLWMKFFFIYDLSTYWVRPFQSNRGLLWNLTGFIFLQWRVRYLIVSKYLSKKVPWVRCTVKSQEMYSKKSRRSYFLLFGIWVIVLWLSNLFSMLPCSSISFWPRYENWIPSKVLILKSTQDYA